MFDPVSPQGKSISDLFIIILLIGAAVFLLVFGLVVYSIIRFRRRTVTDTGEPRQISGNTKLELTWTAGTALVILGLFIPTLLVMESSDPAVPKDAQPDVVIVGHQWWWEYRYPKANVTTANEMYMPTGTKFLARLESSDVQHDFWVPQIGRKMDMYPDHPNQLYMRVDQPGTYRGNCAEYCGTQHAWMLIRVNAVPQAEFDSWLQQQQKPPVVALEQAAQGVNAAPATQNPPTGDPAKGKQVFLNNTCINCHAISGTTAVAKVGPNLTYLGKRSILGAGIIDNNPRNLAEWILNAQKIKPGVLMPAYQLSAEDLRNLVAFLEEQK